MKTQEIFESFYAQTANNWFVKETRKIENILKTFNDFANAHGQTMAEERAKDILENSENLDFLFIPITKVNEKSLKEYNKLLEIRKQLRQKINLGV